MLTVREVTMKKIAAEAAITVLLDNVRNLPKLENTHLNSIQTKVQARLIKRLVGALNDVSEMADYEKLQELEENK